MWSTSFTLTSSDDSLGAPKSLHLYASREAKAKKQDRPYGLALGHPITSTFNGCSAKNREPIRGPSVENDPPCPSSVKRNLTKAHRNTKYNRTEFRRCRQNVQTRFACESSPKQAKIIASQFELTDGPNSDGEMFTRVARLSDNFVGPYENIQAATAANGGAYPPDMSVLVKARKGGADYIYSLLLGYEEAPEGISLDDGVYYNKYMAGNKIKMSNPLSEGIVTYIDGTEATEDQMARDITSFLAWAAEPHLEARHKIGFRAIIYLIIMTVLVYFSMKKLWSRIESKI